MIRPYREVLALPGALAFSAAGLVARLPISMLGIGIVLLVEGSRGSYGLAGAVAAVFGVVAALMAPQVARLVDRFGQGRVLRPAVLLHAAGMGSLVACALADLPVGTLFASAVVAGASQGSVGALVRARWSALLVGTPRLHAAFSLESVLDEVVFIVGPLLVTLLATQVAPAAGLLAAVAAALVGGLALAAQRGTEPATSGEAPAAGSGVARSPGMVALAVTFVLVGGLFGSAEIVTVAFAEEEGRPAAAGAVLAAFALGSMVAGLAYGAVQWRSGDAVRFRWAVVALAVGVAGLPLVGGVLPLALLLCVAGVAISPTIIAGNALVQSLVAPQRLTEGLTWLSTAIGLGMSGGAALSGPLIDAHGARAAFLVTAGSGALAALSALAGSRWLAPRPAAAPGGT
jgi:predicted MFS family arabinose efflux permease